MVAMRRLRTFASAACSSSSLLLCIAACTLWVRSYSGSDYVSRHQALSADASQVHSRAYTLRWTRGRIHLVESDIYLYVPEIVIATSPVPGAGALPPPSWGYGRLGPGHQGWDDPEATSFWNRIGFY